jgi:hypothetical protein
MKKRYCFVSNSSSSSFVCSHCGRGGDDYDGDINYNFAFDLPFDLNGFIEYLGKKYNFDPKKEKEEFIFNQGGQNGV